MEPAATAAGHVAYQFNVSYQDIGRGYIIHPRTEKSVFELHYNSCEVLPGMVETPSESSHGTMKTDEKLHSEKPLSDKEPPQRPKLLARIVTVAFIGLLCTSVLSRLPHCHHAISKLLAPAQPLTVDQRAKSILTHTPLIGEHNISPPARADFTIKFTGTLMVI